jgi:glycosyltransferase involved in cell wall biosynthesis
MLVDFPPRRGGGGRYVEELSKSILKQFSNAKVTLITSNIKFEGDDPHEKRFLRFGGNASTFFLKSLIWGLKNEKQDVYDAHGYVPGLAARILGFVKGSRSVLHVHGFPEKKIDGLKYYFKKSIIQLGFDVVICASDDEYSRISKFVSPEKLYLIRTGVRLGPKKSKINKERAFLYVGRLEPVKGFDILMDSLSSVSKNTRFKIGVIGSGSLKPMISQYAKSNLSYYGTVPYEEAVSLMKRSDVLLMPSRSEGFPLVLLEAMAHGLIVICSDIPQFKKIASSSEGCLVFGHAPEQLASMISAVSSYNDSKLLSLSKSNYDYIVKNDISWDRNARETMKVYED